MTPDSALKSELAPSKVPTLRKRISSWLVQLPRRFATFVWDNPSAEHDARTILSSPKVGLWLGIEVLLILIACAIALFALPEVDKVFKHLGVSIGVGPYLVASTMLMLTGFVTLIVPLRASGLLEGPRWRGYMDQLVTTGMSPLRYFAGKWATSQPFFLALLGASIPFVVLFGLLGEISWTRTAICYLLLYGYCNLLLLVAFGLGSIMHEVLALLGTWAFFASALIMDFTPIPSSMAALTPIRFLIQPFVEIVAGSDASIAGPLYGAANVFSVSVPWPLYALSLWVLIALLVLVTCALGPLHAYVPGLNNFGAVVLPGDSNRNFFRRLRPFLKRRSELAFLFENRGPRLVRWHLPIRALQQVVLLSLGAFILYSAVFDPIVLREVRRDGTVVLHGFASGQALWLCAFVFASGRVDALQRFKLGKFAIPQVAFDTATFTCFLAAIVILHVVGFSAGWSDLTQSRTSFWSRISPEDAFLNSSANLGILMAQTISLFLFLKLVGSRVLSRVLVFFSGVFYVLAINLLPLLAMGVCAALYQSGDPVLVRLASPFMALAEISPGFAMMLVEAGVPPWVRSDHWLITRGFWFWHALWIGFLAWMVFVSHRSLAREAAILAGDVEQDLDPKAEGCRNCRSRRCVPVGLTWWGGWFFSRLVGTVRCLDCREEYSPKTGRPDHKTMFLVSTLRVVLMVLAGALVFWGIVQALV